MSYGEHRTGRDHKDLAPTGGLPPKRNPDDVNATSAVVTHGLTGRLGYFGLGAKAAAFTMCTWETDVGGVYEKIPSGGFVIRTAIEGATHAHELMYTGELIKEKTDGLFLEAAHTLKIRVGTLDGSFFDSKTQGKGYQSGKVGDHEQLLELIRNEGDEDGKARGGTIIAVLNVQPEWIQV
jgi:hypothetical protein